MSQTQLIPIGVEDYKEIIDNKNVYVDKTLLIKEFWQDGGKVILTPRPRRFGKTLNLSMLKYFFEKTNQDTSDLFKNTNIWKDPEYQALQGQYPVIFLTFKDIKAGSWESAFAEFVSLLLKNIEKLLSPIYVSLTLSEQKWYTRLLEGSATETDYTDSLFHATTILERHYQKKVIVLIDEYDAPIIKAYLNNYYEKMIEFIDNLLSKVLKTNPALQKGFLTGISRIAKEGIFSGLNHLSVYTILNVEYADKFGFTQKEVDQLLTNYNLTDKRDEIKNWYDGYRFGDINVYNPWSLLKCIKHNGDFNTYWVNTSNNDLIRDLIARSGQAIKDDIEILLQGKEIVDKEIDEGITLRDLKNNIQNVQGFWSIFLFTGYLTATSRIFKNRRYFYTLALPNEEITLLYEKLITEAINQTLISGQLVELFTAFMTGDQYQLTILLQEFIVYSCSTYDFPSNDPERSIHMLVLGLLAGLSDRYMIKSNRESGHGRYDIMLISRTPQDPGIVIEFKRAKSEDKIELALKAQEALEQIRDKSYVTDIRGSGYCGPVFCYGIAVFHKHVVINMEVVRE